MAFSAQKSTNQTKMAYLPTTHVSYVVALSHATYKEIINGLVADFSNNADALLTFGLCKLYLIYRLDGNTYIRVSSRSGFDSHIAPNVVT